MQVWYEESHGRIVIGELLVLSADDVRGLSEAEALAKAERELDDILPSCPEMGLPSEWDGWELVAIGEADR